MTKYILCVLTSILIISCRPNDKASREQGNPTTDSLAVVNDPKNNLNIQTNSFSEIDSSGVLMFPLAMGETERDGGSLSYKEMPNNGYWNIIFYNSKTKEYHLLSERKMVIGSYDYNYGSGSNDNISTTTNHIFYTICTDDFNRDKKLTNLDPQYLFVSDKSGKNFRQLSPTGYHLNNWKYIKSSNKVLMSVGKDSDNNAKFDNSDEITTFEIELDKDTVAKEIFNDDFKNKLKLLFDRDWKRLKD